MNTRGFTFFELLISVAIFIAISAVTVANLRGGDQVSELKQSADVLVSYLKEAQNRALTGIAADSVNGYGLTLTNGQSVFRTYRDSASSGTARRFDSGELLETVGFRKKVSISSATGDVFFQIPSAQLYLDGAAQTNVVTITLYHSGLDSSININIVPIAGQISTTEIY